MNSSKSAEDAENDLLKLAITDLENLQSMENQIEIAPDEMMSEETESNVISEIKEVILNDLKINQKCKFY